MSTNNQVIILKKKGIFEVHENICVDNDFKSSKETLLHKNKILEDACSFANKYQQENIVEYGIYLHPNCWEKESKK